MAAAARQRGFSAAWSGVDQDGPICHQSVGLVQRAIERRGIPTVSVSVARDVTEHVKPPRAVFVPFRMGHHFGVPFHREVQRRVILEALGLLTTATESGTIPDLPVKWAEVRREGLALERMARDRTH